jgi:hypothetical protein
MAWTDRDAAIDDQMRARHKAARITHQKQNGFSNVVWLTCPANRLGRTALMGDKGSELIGLFARHTQCGAEYGRRNQAGANRIDPNVFRTQLGGRHLAEMNHRCFGR